MIPKITCPVCGVNRGMYTHNRAGAGWCVCEGGCWAEWDESLRQPTHKLEAEVQAELARAEAKHPDWPKDLFRAALIMVGEHGEMLQALQKYEETGDPKWLAAARVEAVQATTMGVRMLKNWPEVGKGVKTPFIG